MIYDFAMFLLIAIGMVSMLFLITFLALRLGKGQLHEMIKVERHPYRFTLLMAVGTVLGITGAYLIQYYSYPSPVETLGYLVFFLFLYISLVTLVLGSRLFNLEKRTRERKSRNNSSEQEA